MVWTLPPRKLPMPQPQPQRYTICGIAGAENCWQVGGKRPSRGRSCAFTFAALVSTAGGTQSATQLAS